MLKALRERDKAYFCRSVSWASVEKKNTLINVLNHGRMLILGSPVGKHLNCENNENNNKNWLGVHRKI